MLETELKAIISKDIYDAVKSMFRWDSVFEQTNSYYNDPTGALKEHGITFRVRTINGKNKVQIKRHKAKSGALQISEESEYRIDNIPELFVNEEVLQLTGVDTMAILLGSLTTKRHSFMYCDGVEICLDKSEYLGVTDYEIEIEYTKEIPDTLLTSLSDVGISFDKISVGKYTRFLNKLNNRV